MYSANLILLSLKQQLQVAVILMSFQLALNQKLKKVVNNLIEVFLKDFYLSAWLGEVDYV